MGFYPPDHKDHAGQPSPLAGQPRGASELKWNQLHGRTLSIPASASAAATAASFSSSASFAPAVLSLPFRHLLSWHADLCYEYATNRGWPLDQLPRAPGQPVQPMRSYVFKDMIRLSPGARWSQRQREPPKVLAAAAAASGRVQKQQRRQLVRGDAASSPSLALIRHPISALATSRGGARGAAAAAATAAGFTSRRQGGGGSIFKPQRPNQVVKSSGM